MLLQEVLYEPILKWAGNKTTIMSELKKYLLLARDWLNLSRVLVL